MDTLASQVTLDSLGPLASAVGQEHLVSLVGQEHLA